jgi:hypothetical protein
VALIGRSAVIVARSRVSAADSAGDSLFVARAALKRAVVLRENASLQVDQLRALVARLEAETRPRP